MPSWTRLRALALWIARWTLLLCGLWALVRCSAAAFGGYDKIWIFTRTWHHRFTSMAMLTGTLRMRNGVFKAWHDEQVYNGAAYTNWGFGVPALQMPFHAVAYRMPWRFPFHFFPDHAIFFFYLAAMIPFLWAAFNRLLAMRQVAGVGRVRRHVLSWAAVLVTLSCTIYPLMSCRFIVYEETISYFIVFELVAIGAYIFAQRSWSSGPVIGLGVACGVVLLVRPTGLVYAGLFGLMVILESRRKKPVALFAGALAPFVCAWSYGNWVRTGSPFALGLQNSLPFSPYHTPMLRFGSPCVDTPRHMMQAATRLFRSFFIAIPNDAVDPPSWMKQCHFGFEMRPPPSESYGMEPFFGVAVLVLLGWILLHHLARRERRLAVYVPFAGMAALFGAYVLVGAGFIWRYAGDFWPLIVLACVQYVRALPVAANRFLGLRLALVFLAISVAVYTRHIKPAQATLEVLTPEAAADQWATFSNSRWSMDPPVASRLVCGDKLAPLFNNGMGWDPGCTVNTFTNVYLGVPSKNNDRYALRFEVEGEAPAMLRVYVNGHIYSATREGPAYTADVRIHYADLIAPTVVATIQWTAGLEVPQIKLLSIEIM
jgi:hypothetical protein